MDARTINVSKDFHRAPAGRSQDDGPYSGEAFRKKVLVPALRSSTDSVSVNLDGTEGYGSSFLEEAFGGLIREDGFTPDELKKKLQLVSEEDPSLIEEVWSYISQARPKKAN